MFKKLFSDREVLQAFVKDVTGVAIEPDIIETEKSFAPPLGAIDIKLDIQRIKYDYHYDRFLHYLMASILDLQRVHTQYKLNKAEL